MTTVFVGHVALLSIAAVDATRLGAFAASNGALRRQEAVTTIQYVHIVQRGIYYILERFGVPFGTGTG